MGSTELLVAEATPRDHRLRVLEGPDAGKAWPVHRALAIGTSEHAEVCLSDPSISRRHAIVAPRPDGLRIEDQGSLNGLWVGDVRVFRADLPAGSTVRVGRTVLEVERVDSPWEEDPTPTGALRDHFGRFQGSSGALAGLYEALHRVAATDATVLVEGESGTGKELLAEALHEEGPRRAGPFVVVDFAAMPETLIEATLFGHERGAFTGAMEARPGAFEEAHGGTIFLDEIGELPPALQTRLLGVLERRRFKRVGGHDSREVDVRVVAATNRNLEREVEQGRFRLDLFHRLAVAMVRVPPLRDRPDDIERLARHFVRQLLRGRATEQPVLSADVLARMTQHTWPGNVRELRNYVERLVVFGSDAAFVGGAQSVPAAGSAGESARADADDADAVAGVVRAAAQSGLPYAQARAQVVDAFTALYVRETLDACDQDVAKAAETAQVARRHFNRLRKRG